VALLISGVVAFTAAALAIRAASAERRDLTIAAVAAAISLVVTPYAQPYDYLLALPALAAAAAAASMLRPSSRTVLLALIVLCWVAGTWVPIVFGQLARAATPSYAAMPVAALVLLAIAVRVRQRPAATLSLA
jgi:hypothetical protein